MCGIAGILSRDGKDVVPLLRDMLEAIKHRGPDGAGIVASGKVSRSRTVGELDWNSLSGSLAMGHTRLAVVGGAQGQQPLVSDDGQIFLLHNGEIYNHKTLRNHLKKYYHFATQTDSEVLIHLLSEHYTGNLWETVRRIIPELDVVYAIAVTDGKDMVIARDLIGVKQLYWTENEKLATFASEKKTLWALGIRGNIHRLLPGEVMHLSSTGLKTTRRTLDFLRPKEPTLHEFAYALEAYKSVLTETVQKRIPELEQVGIFFSGGGG